PSSSTENLARGTPFCLSPYRLIANKTDTMTSADKLSSSVRFVLTMSQFQPELWSLVAVCTRCANQTLLFRNVPERLSNIGGKYSTTCSNCGQRDSFPVVRTRDVGAEDASRENSVVS